MQVNKKEKGLLVVNLPRESWRDRGLVAGRQVNDGKLLRVDA